MRISANTVAVVPAPPKEPEKWTVLGEAVRTLRNERKWSQEDLAAAVRKTNARLTGAYVSIIESGKQENVGRDILRGLAIVFRLSVDELLADVRPESLDPPLKELIDQRKIAPTYRQLKQMVAAGKIILRPQESGKTATDHDWFGLYRLILSYHQ